MLFDDEPEDDDLFGHDEHDDEDESSSSAASQQDELKSARQQTELIAHRDIEKRLLELIAADRLPQSLIFTGPNGVGKSTMAYRLARYLFKYKNTTEEEGGLFGGFDPAPAAPTDSLFVAETDLIAQQVASGGYPDLKIIEREVDDKGKLKVHDLEEVRSVSTFFRKTASVDGGWRIAIIDEADVMNWTAQNALLKILEEPPARSLLILISHRLGAMLPTILSRAIVFNFQPLGDEHVREAIKRYTPPQGDESMPERITRMAAGSIGKAVYYAEPARSEIISQTIGLFSTWPKLDWVRIQAFADSVGPKFADESAQLTFIDTMMWLITSLTKAKSLGQGVPAGLENSGIASMLHAKSLGDLIKISDALKAHFDQVQVAYLDKRFMVMQAYAAFE
jgi:DNA polymerase-3 subunit delta'